MSDFWPGGTGNPGVVHEKCPHTLAHVDASAFRGFSVRAVFAAAVGVTFLDERQASHGEPSLVTMDG